jgi:hypothetical protein
VFPLERSVVLNSVAHLSDLRSELDGIAPKEGDADRHLGDARARFIPLNLDGVHSVDALVSEQCAADLPLEDRARTADRLEEGEAVVRREGSSPSIVESSILSSWTAPRAPSRNSAFWFGNAMSPFDSTRSVRLYFIILS